MMTKNKKKPFFLDPGGPERSGRDIYPGTEAWKRASTCKACQTTYYWPLTDKLGLCRRCRPDKWEGVEQ